MELSFQPYILDFKFNAGTSRGVLKEKQTYILKLQEAGKDGFGLGECGPLKGLSVDDRDLTDKLSEIQEKLKAHTLPDSATAIYQLARELAGKEYPSIRFGLEVAMLDLLNGGERMIFTNRFFTQKHKIPINGLIWMGHLEDMLLQITEKVDAGFSCIKMKVGSIDFEKELDILQYIRRKYYQKNITIRVDANGAFKLHEANEKLEKLSAFDVHSIEQPIKTGQWKEMATLCKSSPIPVALDEELIGVYSLADKQNLLDELKPPYIILKPTLLGGIEACLEWIKLAEERKIGWWLTSALESNIGLNAISQFAEELQVESYQGLGTGQLYHNNFPSPLTIENGFIFYDSRPWDLSQLQL